MKLTCTKSRVKVAKLASILDHVPPARRGTSFQAAVAFQPNADLENEYSIGLLRAAFAEVWETEFNSIVPVSHLRRLLKPPVSVTVALKFARLNVASGTQLEETLIHLVAFLNANLRDRGSS